MEDEIAESILYELRTLNSRLASIDDTIQKGGRNLFTHIDDLSANVNGISEELRNMNRTAYNYKPAKISKPTYYKDVYLDDMKELFELVYKQRPNQWLTKHEIRAIANNKNLFSYLNLSQRSGHTKFGILLMKYISMEFRGIKSEIVGNPNRTARQKIRFTKAK